MNDLKKILEEGKSLQKDHHIPPLSKPLPSFWPWAGVALFLILVSVGIEIFWPLHAHGPLPVCGKGRQKEISCQKGAPPAPSHS